MSQTGIIKIEGMKFYAYHGYYEQEQKTGNDFIVDVEIELEIKDGALINDDLNGTLNYEKIYDLVKTEMEIKSKLLEHVCYRIKLAIHNQFPEIKNLKVSLAKLNPPMGKYIDLVKVIL